ncbi:N-acetylmuramoyl-L-alanine amidase [Feifania hominis]|uniref:Family 10 glycosylhydrolase n=1 Tax=Feifania hominis TaxID=2763660 RepID=A0A926DFG3_9FIRM|nr:N-acetylmuramoyl-L-alanine amidase [Feifania hominis]MBC8536877.1 family 10 glycosylhydrolase [Feifania hominis]
MPRTRKLLSVLLLLILLVNLAPAARPAEAAEAVPEEIRGVWIASVYNIDFPKPGTTTSQQKQQIIDILDTAQSAGLNAVFFQVRPTGDALYKSSLYPWSEVLTGTQGLAPKPLFDPLQVMIDEGKKRGIAIHAWINPYRLTKGSASNPKDSIWDLSSTHPVRQNPSIAVPYTDGKLYLNPGEPAAQNLVVEGVRELVKNYDIAGVVFDDYFYPSGTDKFDDTAAYKKYGGGLSLADWRRKNTTDLVRKTYEAVKAIDSSCLFGVSPSGIWQNSKNSELGSATNGFESYSQIYADTRGWVKEGILDYIAPQIYWPIGYSAADYQVLVDWWSDVCDGTDVKLMISHAAYKVGDSSPAAWTDPMTIPNQIAYNRKKGTVSGSIFYGYSKISSNTLSLRDNLATLFGGGSLPTVTPDPGDGGSQVFENHELRIAYPSNNYKTEYEKTYIIGSADSRYPVTMNGETVARTASGHFACFVALEPGVNTFRFASNGKTIDYKVTCTKGQSTTSAPYQMDSPGFKSGSLAPTSSKSYKVGDKVTLSCIAPSEGKVIANINGTAVALNRGESVSTEGIPCSKFTATYTLPAKAGIGRITVGKPEYVLSYGGKTYKQSAAGTVTLFVPDPQLTVQVTATESIARTGPSSNDSRITPLAKGVTDYVTDEKNGYYKLRYGGYVHKDNVKVVKQTLQKNTITKVTGTRTEKITDIRFTMPVFAPYKLKQNSDSMVFTFYNTVGKEAFTMASSNPLFSAFSFKQDGDNAVYTLTLKQKDGFYGYSMSHENGVLSIKFKNPQDLASGSQTLAGKLILVDAGHGGSDPGAMGPMGKDGPNEAALNLLVAKELETALKARGATVIMTRTQDTSITLDERSAITRTRKPDLSISIHHNSLSSNYDIQKYFGILTMYSENFSSAFAKTMQQTLIAELDGRKDSGTRQTGLAVCRIMDCPSILIEMGYVSNPYEFELLSNSAEIKKEAAAIAKGVENFFVKY